METQRGIIIVLLALKKKGMTEEASWHDGKWMVRLISITNSWLAIFLFTCIHNRKCSCGMEGDWMSLDALLFFCSLFPLLCVRANMTSAVWIMGRLGRQRKNSFDWRNFFFYRRRYHLVILLRLFPLDVEAISEKCLFAIHLFCFVYIHSVN